MKKLIIVKIGGNVIDDKIALKKFLIQFSKINENKLLVHGGGKLATQLSSKLGMKTKMVEGRRITDEETLKVATMVYAGWVNKTISSLLNANNCEAIGLSGADTFLIPSVKRKNSSIDYGFVGDVLDKRINTSLLNVLFSKGITPVIAPITSDSRGQLLNTNADTIASSLAKSLAKKYNVQLLYCFEKNGVLNNNKLIKQISKKNFTQLKNSNVITDGMIPKLDNAFEAISNGVKEVVIGNSKQLNKLVNGNAGTSIK